MVFSSPIFLFFFFPLVLSLYFLLHPKLHNGFLLLASLVFCAWGAVEFVFVLIAAIVLNYLCALMIDKGFRKIGLIASIVGNLGMLGFFKYFNFIVDNFEGLCTVLHLPASFFSQAPQIVLPLGISFYTFKALSYTIDVYWGEAKAQKNFIDFGMFMTMFPQLVAGPIVRYVDIAAQLTNRTVTRRQLSAGIQRFIFGLSKKVIFANPLGEVADKIFAVPVHEVTTGMAWLGIGCYALQIYFDFSGYSDMAIGLGRMFGFEFLENFNYPYISRSVQEFWTRWHISLSTWFHDYLYLPLAFSNWGRVSPRRLNVIVMFVFLVTGIWHGASWSFVIWGGYYGVLLVLERIWLGRLLKKTWRPLQHGYTLFIVLIGWVFFRSETLTQAVRYLASMVGATHANGLKYYALFYCDPKTVLTLLIGCVLVTPIAGWMGQRLQRLFEQDILKHGQILLDLGYYCFLITLFCLSTAYLAAGTYDAFIYFRF